MPTLQIRMPAERLETLKKAAGSVPVSTWARQKLFECADSGPVAKLLKRKAKPIQPSVMAQAMEDLKKGRTKPYGGPPDALTKTKHDSRI